jgi:hypothetical protein
MPAPEHLLPILAQLGDGGTVDMAERVHALIQQARHDEAAEIYAELKPGWDAQKAAQGALVAARADAAAQLADMKTKVATPVPFDPQPGDDALIVIAATLDTDGYWTWDGENGIKADDVLRAYPADITTIAVAPAPAGTLPDAIGDAEPEALYDADADVKATIHDLIERSSLGDPDAAAARASVPLEVGQTLARRAAETARDNDEIDWDDEPTAITTGDLLLAREAAASVAIDRDPEAETIALPPEHRAPCEGGSICGGPHCPPGQDATDKPAPLDMSSGAIRAWAHANNVPVSARGAIGRTTREAYLAAHQEA